MELCQAVRVLRQEAGRGLEFFGEVDLQHMVQAVGGKRLLLGAHAHLEDLLQRLLPGMEWGGDGSGILKHGSLFNR